MELSVSILNSRDRITEVKLLNKTNIDYIHFDVMDGNFVSQKEYTLNEIKELSLLTSIKKDIHLMVNNPSKYLKDLSIINPDYITIHSEIKKNISNILSEIKSYGIKSGLAISPKTKVESIYQYLDKTDLILIMSVEPGLGGQEYLDITDKIIKLKQEIFKRNLSIKIEVDGGINDQNIPILKKVGANIIVIGSYITKSNDQLKTIEKINKIK